MSSVSPTREGFRAVLRRPALAVAEIAWRWSFGATVWLLLAFSCLEYLNTLLVTNADVWFLRTKKAFLVIPALRHIARGSVGRVLIATLVLLSTLALLWMVTAAFGRNVTLNALLDYFAERKGSPLRESGAATQSAESAAHQDSWRLLSLIGLNFLRAAVLLAALLACLGAGILAGFASSGDDPQFGVAMLLFLPLAALIWMTWCSLNWVLSLAAVFAVRDRLDTLASISAAVALFRDRFAPVLAVSCWFGFAHLAAFSAATAAALLLLSLAGGVSAFAVLAGVLAVTVFYFAIADWLCIARLAAYVCIAESPDPDALQRTTPSPANNQGRAELLPQASVDQSEPILSDVPGIVSDFRLLANNH